MTLSDNSNCSPQFPDNYRLLVKEGRMLRSGKHGPVSTLFAAIKSKMI